MNAKSIIFHKGIIIGLCLSTLTGTLMSAEHENYQINGSFEYASNPDIPDYWTGVGRWSRSCNGIPTHILSEDFFKTFPEKFHLDNTTAFHGKKSMRVEEPFFVASNSMSVPSKRDYVISVYLKSSRDNMLVDISAVQADRDKPYLTERVSVTPEWNRYSLQVPKYPHNKLSVMIKPADSGKLWVDAVQIEEGTKLTPFKPSHFDEGFTKPQPLIHIGTDNRDEAPSVLIPTPVAAAPKIDGLLENIWNKAVSLKMGTLVGAPSETPTEVKLLYDDKNLYAAFICDDPRNTKGAGDSIEIFMDLLGIGSPYYQFIFDADGKKRNFRSIEGKHDWDWKADWNVVTRKNKKGWTAEVVIPFSVMPESAEVANIDSLKMNFCRNYSAGPEPHLSWAPVRGTFLEPEKFGTVQLSGTKNTTLEVANLKLISTNPADQRFDLSVDLTSDSPKPLTLTMVLNVESQGASTQTRTIKVTLAPKQKNPVLFKGFTIHGNRVRINAIALGNDGKKIKQIREFVDVPHPLVVYPEYSYYTNEKSARIKVVNNAKDSQPGETLILEIKLAPLPKILFTKSYPFQAGKDHIYDLPLTALRKAHTYTVVARVVDDKGKNIMRDECDLIIRDPNHTEVKVNRFNRGIYLNGEPYIPYGYQVWLLDDKQLRAYKKLGHDYICYTGHWGDTYKNHQFLATCDQLGLKVMDFHAVRPYADSPGKMLEELGSHPSLFAVTPVDESVDKQVPIVLAEAKRTNPYLLCYKNDNVAGYRYWRNQLDGFHGDAVSIDRYPLIHLSEGLPQTTSLIYTFERALEMMDQDAKRERKPVLAWMEAAEAHSKEPTPRELTWLHYIAVVNHCMGFTYFGGVPISGHVRKTILELDKELKAIQPFLFSFEDEPAISFGDDKTKELIRVLPKILNNQLLLICVNRGTESVDAQLNLSSILNSNKSNANVMFEARNIPIDKDRVLRDKFTPLGRHVYKINLR